MATAQLDMLTDSVYDTLLKYIKMINRVSSSNEVEKVELLHGLIEYMLTNEVIHGVIMRSKFDRFNNLLFKKLEIYRQYSLVLQNEYMMKAMDELQGIIYNNCILKCDCKCRYCLYKENTRPRGKIMLERPQFVKDESIAKLKKVAAYADGSDVVVLRRSERCLMNKRKRDE